MRKRIFSWLLIWMIFIGQLGVVQAKTVRKLDISNYQSENITFTIKDKVLTMESHLTGKKYTYFNLRLYQEKEYYNEQMVENKEHITYSLKGIKKGIYHLAIYYSSKKYGTYTSYMYGKKSIQIKIGSKSAEFVYPLTYESNRKYLEQEACDEATLSYYLQPTKQIQCQNQKLVKAAYKITKSCKTEYEKALAIHDWICEHIYYNNDVLLGKEPLQSSTALDTYNTRIAVCEGYAYLTCAMLRAVGIPSKVATGYAIGYSGDDTWTKKLIKSGVSNHAWNEAFVDGRWILMDTTWDSDHRYNDGKKSVDTGLKGYKYFDTTIEYFSIEHLMIPRKDEVEEYKESGAWSLLSQMKISPLKKTLYLNGERNTQDITIVRPEDANNKYISYTYVSSQPKIAAVNEDGTITAVGEGKATILVFVKVDGISRRFSTDITVK